MQLLYDVSGPIFVFLVCCGHFCSGNKINVVKLVISFASVQLYIQIIVPLCDYNSNIRKQIYVTYGHGFFNK